MNQRVLRSVTREFNKYRSPECKAKVLFNGNEILGVVFSGTKLYLSCYFDENFIDYRYYLKDISGKDFAIINIIKKIKHF